MSEKWHSYSVIVLATVVLVIMSPVLGEWSDDPTQRTPVCTANYAQRLPWLVTVDGGFVASWNDQRRGSCGYNCTYNDVYAQKFTIDGEMLWLENGRVIAKGPVGSLEQLWQFNTGLTHDGKGGGLIAWNDSYPGYYEQGFVTKAASDATVAWGDPGEPIQSPDTAVPMLANAVRGANPMSAEWGIAADSEGGLFAPVYTSLGRFDAEGHLRTEWFYDAHNSEIGMPVGLVPVVEPGGEDGVIVVWINGNGYFVDSILARKLVDPETSSPMEEDAFVDTWGELSLYNPENTISAWRLRAVPDDSGGVIAAWIDSRTGNFGLYAQRVNAAGNLVWGPEGIAVSGDTMASNWFIKLAMAADGEGGAVIAWNDADDIQRAQRIAADGSLQWGASGVVLDTETGIYTNLNTHGLIRATDGNYIVLYHHEQEGKLIAQKLNSALGTSQWGAGEVVYEGCFSTYYEYPARIVSDRRAGAVVAFAACDGDIYAHRVEGMSEDLVIDFGGIGLWARMNDATWLKLNNASPEEIVVGDMDGNGEDDVIAVFGSGIFVKRNLGPWAQLHNFTPEAMAIGDLDNNGQDDVVIDFGGIGLWARMNDSSWLKLNNASPTQITVGDMDGNGADDVIAVFSSGIFVTRNLGAWAQLHNFIPEALAVGDLDNNGQDDVVIDFGGIALWARMNDSSWLKLHNTSPDVIATGDIDGNGADDVLATFGSSFVGLWQKQNLGGWSQLNTNVPDAVISGDVDAGQDDIIASFGTTIGGIYVKRNQGAWGKLHNSTPDSMAAGQLDGS